MTYEIPLNEVSRSTTGKNEVTLEFHQHDDAQVSLMEMRFHLPATNNDDEDYVQTFNEKVLDKATIIQATGDAIAEFTEVSCLTPRYRVIVITISFLLLWDHISFAISLYS